MERNLLDIGNDQIFVVAVSDKLIAMGGDDGKISVYRKHGHNFKLLRTIDLGELDLVKLHKSYIRDVSFINDDIVMVTTSNNGIYIVSVESGRIIPHFEVENSKGSEHASVQSDGRLCVGGSRGYCGILKPPKEAEVFIGTYVKGIREEMRRLTGGDSGHPLVSLLEDRNDGGTSEGAW